MKQVIPGARDANNTGATNYFTVAGSSGNSFTTETNVETIVATGGTIGSLRVVLDAAPTAGKNYVYTLRLNGADTALTCTVADSATTGSDTTHNVTVAAGDRIAIKCVPTGTPAASNVSICSTFTGTTANESLVLGSTRNGSLSTSASEFLALMVSATAGTATAKRVVVPTGGNITNLYVNLVTAPGVGTTRVFTLYKNGVASALTVTVSGAATTGNDTAHSIAVVAGDELMLQSDLTGTPAASPVRFGMKFVATTDGESIIFGNSGAGNPGAAGTFYFYPQDARATGQGTETNVQGLMNATTLKKWYMVLDAAPGVGNTETRDVRINAASPANDLSIAISGGSATTGNDTTHSVTVADGDLFDFRLVMGVETAYQQARWGVVGFISSAVAQGDFFPFF